jgi:hypothetical protein
MVVERKSEALSRLDELDEDAVSGRVFHERVEAGDLQLELPIL